MKSSILLVCTLALLSTPVLADNDKGKGKGKPNQGNHQVTTFCSPGLAKKDNGCIPPGQADKLRGDYDYDHHDYRVGDLIPDGYVLVRDPWRYGYSDPGTYWRVGDTLFRVDGGTGEVLAVLGLLSNLLN